jgi:hypothetical protein
VKVRLPKFGAEPKKLGFLVVLLIVAAYFFFSRDSGDTGTVARPAGGVPPALGPRAGVRSGNRLRPGERGLNNGPKEFRPSFKAKDLDPSGVDPTLHLDLLAKLQDVKVEGEGRSLFEIGAAPPAELAKLKEPEKIKPRPVGPQPPAPPPPPPPDPKAPPIPLKFYGFVNQSKAGDKRAFFLDGDDIIIATEGDTIKKRYKIVRIGVSSAVVEDTQFKGTNTQQTLQLEAEMAG